MKRALVALTLLGAMLLGTGAEAAPAGADSTPPTRLGIAIAGLAFHPNDAVVAPRATIVVRNVDWSFFGEPHTMTAFNGAFDTGPVLSRRESFPAPARPGDYWYFCEVHTFMVGVLRVAGQ